MKINIILFSGSVLLVGIAAWALAGDKDVTAGLEGPACDDQEVLDFVMDAFDAAQEFETRSGLSLVDISDVRELDAARFSSGSWRQIRACAAQASLSSGRSIASWHQVRLPKVDDAIGYRVKVCFEDFDPVSGGDCTAFESARQ